MIIDKYKQDRLGQVKGLEGKMSIHTTSLQEIRRTRLYFLKGNLFIKMIPLAVVKLSLWYDH